MRKITFAMALYCSLQTFSIEANTLPPNALSYGLTTPRDAAVDPAYGGNSASTEFNVCMKNAMTGGQAMACFDDEEVSLKREIDSLMNVIYDSKSVPNDAKVRFINGVKTDLSRINYLCDVYKINAEGNKDADIGDYPRCRIIRLVVLKKSITNVVNEP